MVGEGQLWGARLAGAHGLEVGFEPPEPRVVRRVHPHRRLAVGGGGTSAR